MSSSEVWEVACYVCGFKLGSNKEKCGAGNKKVKNPPCKWAHTDSAIVSKCFRFAQQKAKDEEDQQKLDAQLQIDYENGSLQPNFDEPEHAVDREQREREERERKEVDEELALVDRVTFNLGKRTREERDGDVVLQDKPPQKRDTIQTEDKSKEEEKGKTKWNCKTRTMFFKCILKFDPFSSPDKGKVWDRIADEMHKATATLVDTEDGDFRCYSNGKSLNVYYTRRQKKQKENEDGEKHSGVAGKEESDPSLKEERIQLAACIELERSAKEVVEQKREDKKAYDTLRNGEVNDMVIACAVSNVAVRTKAVKVLASRLRAAKMRKSTWELANKNGKYTYTQADLMDFEQWRQMRVHDGTLPIDPTDGETSETATGTAPRGGALANSITQMLDRMPTAAQMQPVSPQDFANAFWTARSEHETRTKLSLKEKLALVDNDVADNTITKEEGETFKEAIKKEHYKF